MDAPTPVPIHTHGEPPSNPPHKEPPVPLEDAWAVHWPNNPDGEPIHLFASELDAKAFSRHAPGHTTVSWEPIRQPEQARRLIRELATGTG